MAWLWANYRIYVKCIWNASACEPHRLLYIKMKRKTQCSHFNADVSNRKIIYNEIGCEFWRDNCASSHSEAAACAWSHWGLHPNWMAPEWCYHWYNFFPQNIQSPNSEIQQIIFYLYGYSTHILRKLIFMKTVAPEPVYRHKMELYFRLINYEYIQKTK